MFALRAAVFVPASNLAQSTRCNVVIDTQKSHSLALGYSEIRAHPYFCSKGLGMSPNHLMAGTGAPTTLRAAVRTSPAKAASTRCPLA
jgi:hypothetical protein